MTAAPHTAAPRSLARGAQDRWLARRRWARAAWLYAFMLVMSFVFLGPFVTGALSSVKDNPNEYPPSLNIPQLTPQYIARAWSLGAQGSGDGWQEIGRAHV